MQRQFELHFIFCVLDWWPMRWMMFCSAVWHCLILADTKRENTYHLRLMYRAGGRGCQNGEEGPRGWGVGVRPNKRDGDGLMTAEADGGSHLPWRRSQTHHPWSQRGTDTEQEGETWKPSRRDRKTGKRHICACLYVPFHARVSVCSFNECCKALSQGRLFATQSSVGPGFTVTC